MKATQTAPDLDSLLKSWMSFPLFPFQQTPLQQAPFQQAMLDQSRLWLTSQMQALAAMERFNEGWMRRRRADLEGALAVVERMSAAGDPGAQGAALNEWLSGCSQRVAEDLQSMSDCLSAVARNVNTTATDTAERARPGSRGPEVPRRAMG
ncbi:hypothetical protein [Azospirillum sp. sgz302134]